MRKVKKIIFKRHYDEADVFSEFSVEYDGDFKQREDEPVGAVIIEVDKKDIIIPIVQLDWLVESLQYIKDELLHK